MITFRFLVWVALFIFSILSAHFKLRLFPYVIIIFLALLPIFSFIFMLIQKKQLEVSFTKSSMMVERHQEASWDLSIKNHSKWMPTRLHLIENKNRIDIALNPNQEYTHHFSKISQHTGSILAPDFSLELFDPFNFFSAQLDITHHEPILVYPLFSSPLFSERAGQEIVEEVKLAAIRSHQHQDEVQSIRPIAPGDSMKKIHWKLSARIGQWMVRQDEVFRQPQLEFVIIPDSLENPSELQLDARDAFLDVAAVQSLLLMQSKSIKSDEIESIRERLARIDYQHELNLKSLRQSRPNTVFLIFLQTLTKETIEDAAFIRNQGHPLLIYLFNPLQDEALLKLAKYHQLNIMTQDNQDEE